MFSWRSWSSRSHFSPTILNPVIGGDWQAIARESCSSNLSWNWEGVSCFFKSRTSSSGDLFELEDAIAGTLTTQSDPDSKKCIYGYMKYVKLLLHCPRLKVLCSHAFFFFFGGLCLHAVGRSALRWQHGSGEFILMQSTSNTTSSVLPHEPWISVIKQ